MCVCAVLPVRIDCDTLFLLQFEWMKYVCGRIKVIRWRLETKHRDQVLLVHVSDFTSNSYSLYSLIKLVFSPVTVTAEFVVPVIVILVNRTQHQQRLANLTTSRCYMFALLCLYLFIFYYIRSRRVGFVLSFVIHTTGFGCQIEYQCPRYCQVASKLLPLLFHFTHLSFSMLAYVLQLGLPFRYERNQRQQHSNHARSKARYRQSDK